eukprot:1329972-Pleurochrysis_carterae.AAC.1
MAIKDAIANIHTLEQALRIPEAGGLRSAIRTASFPRSSPSSSNGWSSSSPRRAVRMSRKYSATVRRAELVTPIVPSARAKTGTVNGSNSAASINSAQWQGPPEPELGQLWAGAERSEAPRRRGGEELCREVPSCRESDREKI